MKLRSYFFLALSAGTVTHPACMELTPAQTSKYRAKQAQTIPCTWPNCKFHISNSTMAAHLKAHEECDGKIYQCQTDDCRAYFYRSKQLESHCQEKHLGLGLSVEKKIIKVKNTQKKSRVKSLSAIATVLAQQLPVNPVMPQLASDAPSSIRPAQEAQTTSLNADAARPLSYRAFCALQSRINSKPVGIHESPSALGYTHVRKSKFTQDSLQSWQQHLKKYECCKQFANTYSYKKHVSQEHPELYDFHHCTAGKCS